MCLKLWLSNISLFAMFIIRANLMSSAWGPQNLAWIQQDSAKSSWGLLQASVVIWLFIEAWQCTTSPQTQDIRCLMSHQIKGNAFSISAAVREWIADSNNSGVPECHNSKKTKLISWFKKTKWLNDLKKLNECTVPPPHCQHAQNKKPFCEKFTLTPQNGI